LLLVRFFVQAVLLLPILWWSGGRLTLPPRLFRLAFLRTLLHIIGIGAMFSALRYLPLADAIAIAFVMPFIVLLLGKTVLKEDVGTRRLVACGVGFVGTLLVIQPGFASVGLPALLPLLVALVFALFMLVTRHIAKEVDPVALQAINGIMALPVLGLAVLAGYALDVPMLQLIAPQGSDFALLALVGVLGTGAHLLMTFSLRHAPSATLAPMQYLEIPVATLIGWLIFSEFPNGLAALGIVITVAAGLYVIWREKRTIPAMS
jgi:drug/metabolite transporter (DMT)-like permease